MCDFRSSILLKIILSTMRGCKSWSTVSRKKNARTLAGIAAAKKLVIFSILFLEITHVTILPCLSHIISNTKMIASSLPTVNHTPILSCKDTSKNFRRIPFKVNILVANYSVVLSLVIGWI